MNLGERAENLKYLGEIISAKTGIKSLSLDLGWNKIENLEFLRENLAKLTKIEKFYL